MKKLIIVSFIGFWGIAGCNTGADEQPTEDTTIAPITVDTVAVDSTLMIDSVAPLKVDTGGVIKPANP